MLSKLWSQIKDKAGVAVAAALAILFVLFKYEQNKANKEGVALENAQTSQKDAVLAEKQSEDVKAIAQDKQDAAAADAAVPSTPQAEVDALNKALQ